MNWRNTFNRLPEDEQFEMLMEMYTTKKHISSVVLFSIGGYKIKSHSRKEYKILAIRVAITVATFYLIDLYFNFFGGVTNRLVQITIVLLINLIVKIIVQFKNKIFTQSKVKEKEQA